MKLILPLLIVALLSGCANRGFFRGAVDGDKMLKVHTVEGKGSAWYKPFAEAQAGVNSVIVESTSEEITGVTIYIKTENLDVKVIK